MFLGVFQVIWTHLKSLNTLNFCTLWSSDFQRVKPSRDLNSVSALYHICFSVQYIVFFVSHVSNDSSKSCAKAEAVAAMEAKELHQNWGTLEVLLRFTVFIEHFAIETNKRLFDIN